MTSSEFQADVRSQVDDWGEVIKAAGVQSE